MERDEPVSADLRGELVEVVEKGRRKEGRKGGSEYCLHYIKWVKADHTLHK